MNNNEGLAPGPILERLIRVIDISFGYANIHYWVHFGALWGLCKNNGIIPDGDIDCCVYYGSDWHRIVKSFQSNGYTLRKAIINDRDPENILYCGFNREGWPHICVSFWYLHEGIRYYCHDQHFELHQIGEVGVPPSGYFFKGMPDFFVSDKSMFRRVEWPGINQAFKISVPLLPGLDYMYPGWPYGTQKYNIDKDNKFREEKTFSLYRHGATSPYKIHVNSMTQWDDTRYIQKELEASKLEWTRKLKEIRA